MSSPRFVDTLVDLQEGHLQNELTDALRELVARVQYTGKPGKLTLVLKVRKAAKGDGRSLTIAADVKTQLPQPDVGETIMFATDDNFLTRRDPLQPRLVGMAGDDQSRVVPMNPPQEREAQTNG